MEDWDLMAGIVHYKFRDTCEYGYSDSAKTQHFTLDEVGSFIQDLGVMWRGGLSKSCLIINPKHPQDLQGFTFEGKAIKELNRRYLIWNYKDNQWEMYK